MKIALIIVSAVALFALAGRSLYSALYRKPDSRMEVEWKTRMHTEQGKHLVEFEWRQNHRNYYSCFSLKFYRENDMPAADRLVSEPIRR